jgi:predicted TIM-barrel fold metal-dependent hydrolase
MPLIVDTHVHVYRTREEGQRAKGTYEIWEYGSGGSPRFAHWSGDADDAVAAMSAAEVRYAVVANLLDRPAEGVDAGPELLAFNAWLFGLASQRPEFVPCLAVDPGCLPVPELVAHIRDMTAHRGAVGIKLHPPLHRIDLTDEAIWPVFETCQELGLRVVSHSGPSREGKQYGEPDAFRPLLDAFPRLRISLAHLGGGAWQQTPRLAADYEHLFFDCCEIIEWLGAARAPSRQRFVQLLRDVGTGRVMMGSDFPWYDMAHTVDLVKTLPGLTDHEQRQVLGENAMRFFGLSSQDAAA